MAVEALVLHTPVLQQREFTVGTGVLESFVVWMRVLQVRQPQTWSVVRS